MLPHSGLFVFPKIPTFPPGSNPFLSSFSSYIGSVKHSINMLINPSHMILYRRNSDSFDRTYHSYPLPLSSPIITPVPSFLHLPFLYNITHSFFFVSPHYIITFLCHTSHHTCEWSKFCGYLEGSR